MTYQKRIRRTGTEAEVYCVVSIGSTGAVGDCRVSVGRVLE